MSKIKDTVDNVVDTGVDLLDKVSSPSSRAGSTIERAAKMTREGVDKDVTALQMTKNSPNKQTYSAADVEAYSKLYKDTETKVVITSKQATALIKDQKESTPDAGNLAPQS
ncbi:hypothetical protein CGI03_23405 [Vibrio parahaemolyticus]|uniref:hypothetical protein n=1 Tax=Vibrio parahaemolyticus TaxID=670 RepID=UPI000416A027|nr:hypothetical protein [Vibrio parahaemolyticus]EGQ8136995.1 hypothetical protein [Vibrio parahaemolyticus]EGQ8148771.1 hypothetical protein [Vibrio parahaemolyticus]EGQ8250616.1 hypothetical protein [Vibrio parahaemolyticus]EGQ8265097.1 hypothetical protein [Vibrio parahaemolyticus]EGQ8270717.1 hypothetical protein [Vibrio parahaemolyticus]